jgi:hypothetical protein
MILGWEATVVQGCFYNNVPKRSAGLVCGSQAADGSNGEAAIFCKISQNRR